MYPLKTLAYAAFLVLFSSSLAEAAQIYWSNYFSGRIRRANLDGSEVTDVVTSQSYVDGLAIDDVNGQVYWSSFNQGAIFRANLDGTGTQTVVSNLYRPEYICLDPADDRMYWVTTGYIQLATLDGVSVRNLVPLDELSTVLALDLTNQKIYFNDFSNLLRANLDGTVVEQLPLTHNGIGGMAVDPVHGKLYITSYNRNRIERTNLDGTGRETVLSGLNLLTDLDLDLTANKMYWAQENVGIRRANLDGTQVETVVSGIGSVKFLRLGGLGNVDPSPFEVRTVIPSGAVWRFLADGNDQENDWKEMPFDASGWPQGRAQLGYGDGDEATVVSFGGDPNNKYPTTYFRHEFYLDAADLALLDSAFGSLLRDDGAVVYLNGVEVYRDASLRPGAGYLELANFNGAAAISGTDENTWNAVTIDAALLREGLNVIGVEVHQQAANSSDISFDFELRSRFAVVPEPSAWLLLMLGGIVLAYWAVLPTVLSFPRGERPGAILLSRLRTTLPQSATNRPQTTASRLAPSRDAGAR